MQLLATVLPLVALSNAFVILDESLVDSLVKQVESVPAFATVEDKVRNVFAKVEHSVENALDVALSAAEDAQNDLLSAASLGDLADDFDSVYGHHGRHGHHDKPNRTVYELINESKYTTTLAKFINKFPDVVEALNSTSNNFTIFAPTDGAFERASHYFDKEPSDEQLKKLLTYHASADFYPASRVLKTHTIPSLYKEDHIGGNLQRIRVGLSLKGLHLNFYSRVIAINIFGTNGVIHGLHLPLMIPPQVSTVFDLVPGEFSTLRLALEKTGLWKEISEEHKEFGTAFAPSNHAWKKLGPAANAYLFSKAGEKHLRALLKYHLVPDYVVYSDAYYHGKNKNKENVDASYVNDRYHVELDTALPGKSLSLDIARWGLGFVTMRINGFTPVTTQDGVAKDGVIHEIPSVLIPPRHGKTESEEVTGEISVEDLIDRLDVWTEEL